MRNGFSLVELLVVITIILLLVALLAPALEKSIQHAQRVACAGNQRVIAAAAFEYGMNNRKTLFIPRGREMTMGFDTLGTESGQHAPEPEDKFVDWPAALATVGLASRDKQQVQTGGIDGSPGQPLYVNNAPGKMWDCPGRPQWNSYYLTIPSFTGDSHALLVGYMYYGGVARWRSFLGEMRPAPTPRKLSDPGDRALTADVTGKATWWVDPRSAGPQWGGDVTTEWYLKGVPHADGANPWPAGHNQSFLDNSVQWFDADKLLMIHTWNHRGDELFFFWQKDLGGWSYNPNNRNNDPFQLPYHKYR